MQTLHKTDVQLQRDVMDEFDWDPEVMVTEVGVEVDDGVVTLTGVVESFSTKWAAERAAFRVAGVRAVANDIIVRMDSPGYRTDTDIAKDVANAFERNLVVPEDRIEIRVADGEVTLDGEVEWYYQREAADEVIRDLPGVTHVTNYIVVIQPPEQAADIYHGIEQALLRNAEVDAESINVTVEGGTATLHGSVRSWSERMEAEQVAWKARGITRVINEIRIRGA
jgi:osmotically-inducible protein OsmY